MKFKDTMTKSWDVQAYFALTKVPCVSVILVYFDHFRWHSDCCDFKMQEVEDKCEYKVDDNTVTKRYNKGSGRKK